jgi:hypothetical protein
MALVTPLLMVILFGAVELGNYFWSEHVLAKGVRDAAVYASRLSIENYDCPSATTVSDDVKGEIKNVARTGVVSGGTDRLPLWDDGATEFDVAVNCVTEVGPEDEETGLAGIYTLNDGQVPVVTLTATLPYRSLLGTLGLSNADLHLNASQEAAVVGA